MDFIMKYLPVILAVPLSVYICFYIIRHIYKNHIARPVTVSAEVTDKLRYNHRNFSEYGKGRSIANRVLVFSAEGRELRFFVPAGLFNRIEKGHKGQLTYRGNKFISFD